jgi:hypothetical protein
MTNSKAKKLWTAKKTIIIEVIDPDERHEASQIGGKVERMMEKDKELKSKIFTIEDEHC